MRILRVLYEAVVPALDPLRPSGQHAAVAEIEMPLYFALSDEEVALAEVIDHVSADLCAHAHFDPADPHVFKSRTVDTKSLRIAVDPAGAFGICSVRAAIVDHCDIQCVFDAVKSSHLDRAAPLAVIKQIACPLFVSYGDPIIKIIEPVLSVVDLVVISVLILHKSFDAERSSVLPFSQHGESSVALIRERVRVIVVYLGLKSHSVSGQDAVVSAVCGILADLRRKGCLLSDIDIAVDLRRPQLQISRIHTQPVIVLRDSIFAAVFDGDNNVYIYAFFPVPGNILKADDSLSGIRSVRRDFDHIGQFLPRMILMDLQAPVVGDPGHLLFGAGMLLSALCIILLVGCLCAHKDFSSAENSLGTAVCPYIHTVDIAADIERERFRSALGAVPIRISHGHLALAHVLCAELPAVLIAALYSDHVFSVYRDIGHSPLEVLSVRILPVLDIDPLPAVDPLLPSGQKAPVVEVKLVLHIAFPDFKLALAEIGDRIPSDFCAHPDFDPADPHFLKSRTVYAELPLTAFDPAGAVSICPLRSVMLRHFRRQHILCSVKIPHFDRTGPLEVPGAVLKQTASFFISD